MQLDTPEAIIKAISNKDSDLRRMHGAWWLHEADTFTRKRKPIMTVPDAAVDALLKAGLIEIRELHGLEVARKSKGGNKHNARRTTVGDLTFDSTLEAKRYGVLRLMEKAGEIADLEVHPEFVLQEGFTTPAGKREQPIRYTPDFTYRIPGQDRLVAEDVKGYKGIVTDAFRIRARLFGKRYPEYDLRVVDGQGNPLKAKKSAAKPKPKAGKAAGTAKTRMTAEEYRRLIGAEQ